MMPAAEAICSGPRAGPGALRTHVHQAGRVETCDGAAASADRMYVDRRRNEIVVVDAQCVGNRDAPCVHQHHIAAGTTDLHRHEVVLTDTAGQVLHCPNPGRWA